MNSNGQVVVEAISDRGMGGLDRSGFEAALLELVADWLQDDSETIVIACGMVGARQGWIEVPYQQAPSRPVFSDRVGRPVTLDQRLSVIILPGIKQLEPADVMRGEETQISGLLLNQPDFDGVLCLPGTHTKWVKVRAGQIRRAGRRVRPGASPHPLE